MTKGPNRLVLDQYLDSAAGGALQGAGRDWKRKAQELQTLSDALKMAAQQAELRIGEQTLTGPALRAGMEKSSSSMLLKSEQLEEAGQALVVVGQQVADTRDARDSMADLGEKPAVYQPPPGTPGVGTTDEEIAAQAAASAAREQQRSAWQSAYDKQEAKALALTKAMDAAFISAIPPMQAIHGQEDPTEPPPSVPSGPDGPYLPGTPTPGTQDPSTPPRSYGVLALVDDNGDDEDNGGGKDKDKDPVITKPPPPPVDPNPHPTTHPTTAVTGTSQSGITYSPTGGSGSVPGPVGSGPSAGASAAALGAAGGAGGMAAGAIRPGAVPTSATRGATPVRPIGSTSRTGGAGALSRPAGAAGGATRGAGSAGGRGTGSASGRGSATGSAGGRAGAGGRGAGPGGSRSGSRGSAGASGRGGRKGQDVKNNERDSLVYDQDWLGDDDVAPGVLD